MEHFILIASFDCFSFCIGDFYVVFIYGMNVSLVSHSINPVRKYMVLLRNKSKNLFDNINCYSNYSGNN